MKKEIFLAVAPCDFAANSGFTKMNILIQVGINLKKCSSPLRV